MDFLPLLSVHLNNQHKIFKNTAIKHLIVGLIMLTISVILFVIEIPLIFKILSGPFLIIFAIYALSCFLKSFNKNNWLLAIAPDSILIKFRSYLNQKSSDQDIQVIRVLFSKVTSAKITKQKMITADTRGRKCTAYYKYLDLIIDAENFDQLKQHIKDENARTHSSKTGPVKVTSSLPNSPVTVPYDNTIRIEWSSPGSLVRPSIKNVLETLARQNINIVPAEKEIADYTPDKATSPKILEENIIDLLQKDKKLAAINLARKTYGYSQTEAKDFVESLLR